ncbi:hypothetical protein Ancab_037801 [Ancistrocladus abbreviatus]
MEKACFSSPSCTLEITIISAEGLSMGPNRPVGKNTFVTIQTDPCSQQVETFTKVDKQGGCFPAWNEKLVITMPMHAKFITLEVNCKATANGRDKLIGAAQVPVSDFVGGLTPSNYLHFLSYRLRNLHGEKNGIINFSVKVKGLLENHCLSYVSKGAWTGFPMAVGDSNYRGVVNGVPAAVWYSSYNL